MLTKLKTLSFMYWASEYVLDLLINGEKLSPKYADAKKGISTGDNNKYIYNKWEVKNKTGFVNVANGGGFNKYLGLNQYIIYADFDEMKKNSGCTIRNRDYFYKEGIEYSKVVSNNKFSARVLYSDYIRTDTSLGIYINNEKVSIKYLIGVINTKCINYLLMMLNPGEHFNTSDVNEIPFIQVNNEVEYIVESIVNMLISLKIYFYRFNVLSEVCVNDAIIMKHTSNKESIMQICVNICRRSYLSEIIFSELEYLLDEIILKVYKIPDDDIKNIYNQFGYSPNSLPIITNSVLNDDNIDNDISESEKKFICFKNETWESVLKSLKYVKRLLYKFHTEGIKIGNLVLSLNSNSIILEQCKLDNIIEKIKAMCEISGMNIMKISEELKINPRSVLAIMEENNLYIKDDLVENIKRYLQTLARKSFDEDTDGIVLLPEMLDKIHDELINVFGDRATSIETEINNIIGKSIEKWLQDEFANDYINNTGYDRENDKYDEIKKPWEPLIWKGQSSKKYFTVFVWRYKITPDTELKIRSQYIENETDSLNEKVKELDIRLSTMEGKEKDRLEKSRDEILDILDDLNNYHKWIEENGVKLRGMWFNRG